MNNDTFTSDDDYITGKVGDIEFKVSKKALADLEKFHNINAEQEVIELLEKEREWILQQAKDNKNES